MTDIERLREVVDHWQRRFTKKEDEVERLRAELAGVETVRREQADGRDYWCAEATKLRAERDALRERAERAEASERPLLQMRDELLAENEQLRAELAEMKANWEGCAETCSRLHKAINKLEAELAELRDRRAANMPAYVRRTLNLARAVEEFQASGRAGFIVARADELDKEEEAAIDAARTKP